MEYIRENREKPNFDPNHRHCMVGQDADLIMLALATHEPHFTLLREVIDFNANRRAFGSKNIRQTIMRQTKDCQFQLLHISVLREYIELDLSMPVRSITSDNTSPVVVPRKLDRERLIDDFIFLTFLDIRCVQDFAVEV